MDSGKSSTALQQAGRLEPVGDVVVVPVEGERVLRVGDSVRVFIGARLKPVTAGGKPFAV
jgi:hypothetical protein